jgi:hypothetical protein
MAEAIALPPLYGPVRRTTRAPRLVLRGVPVLEGNDLVQRRSAGTLRVVLPIAEVELVPRRPERLGLRVRNHDEAWIEVELLRLGSTVGSGRSRTPAELDALAGALRDRHEQVRDALRAQALSLRAHGAVPAHSALASSVGKAGTAVGSFFSALGDLTPD